MRATASGLLTVILSATACGNAATDIAEVSLANAPANAPITSTEAPAATSTVTTTAESPTPTPTAAEAPGNDRSAEDEIRAVTDLSLHALVEGMNPPNPDHDVWALVAVGERLESFRARAAQKLAAGEGNRYRNERHSLIARAEFLLLEDTRAVIDMCVVDDTLLYDLTTGEILDDEIRLGHFQVALDLTDAGWRVARALLINRLETEDECDSAF